MLKKKKFFFLPIFFFFFTPPPSFLFPIKVKYCGSMEIVWWIWNSFFSFFFFFFFRNACGMFFGWELERVNYLNAFRLRSDDLDGFYLLFRIFLIEIETGNIVIMVLCKCKNTLGCERIFRLELRVQFMIICSPFNIREWSNSCN